MKFLYNIFIYSLLLYSFLFAQTDVKIKDPATNILLQINDEGTAGSLTLPPLSSISSPFGKLYNIGGTLFWGSTPLGASSGAGWTDAGTSIYNTTLTDKVGIGTNNPLSTLSVGGDGDGTVAIFASGADIGIFTEGADIGIKSVVQGGTGIGGSFSGDQFGIRCSSPEYAGSFSGKVEIRHNSTATNPQLIIQESENNDYGRISFSNINESYYWSIAAFNSSINSEERFNIFNNTTGDIITATGDGKVGIMTINPAFTLHVNGTAGKPGGGSWSVASDIRLKKDIKDFTDGLNVISKIHTVSFNYNGKNGYAPDKRYIGVIAQEMQRIAPYMISETKTADGEFYLQFDPSAMDFITVNAIKEQQKIIDNQLDRIKELEDRLSKLENIVKSDNLVRVNN